MREKTIPLEKLSDIAEKEARGNITSGELYWKTISCNGSPSGTIVKAKLPSRVNGLEYIKHDPENNYDPKKIAFSTLEKRMGDKFETEEENANYNSLVFKISKIDQTGYVDNSTAIREISQSRDLTSPTRIANNSTSNTSESKSMRGLGRKIIEDIDNPLNVGENASPCRITAYPKDITKLQEEALSEYEFISGVRKAKGSIIIPIEEYISNPRSSKIKGANILVVEAIRRTDLEVQSRQGAGDTIEMLVSKKTIRGGVQEGVYTLTDSLGNIYSVLDSISDTIAAKANLRDTYISETETKIITDFPNGIVRRKFIERYGPTLEEMAGDKEVIYNNPDLSVRDKGKIEI